MAADTWEPPESFGDAGVLEAFEKRLQASEADKAAAALADAEVEKVASPRTEPQPAAATEPEAAAAPAAPAAADDDDDSVEARLQRVRPKIEIYCGALMAHAK